MPQFAKRCTNPAQLVKIRNGQRKRNYQQTAHYPRRKWNAEEDKMVLERSMPDRKLSAILRRSVESIQIRRSRLQNK